MDSNRKFLCVSYPPLEGAGGGIEIPHFVRNDISHFELRGTKQEKPPPTPSKGG